MGQRGINYIYFGSYFLILLLLAVCGIFTKENLGGSRLFFFLYAAGQALIESSLLAFIAWILRRTSHKILFYFFVGATFLFCIFHIIDFFIDRILDLSVWETLGFLFDETFSNFLYLLDASGVPLWAWAIIFGSLALIPLVGIFLYRVTEAIADRRPFTAKPEYFFVSLFCLPLGLLFWDFSASRTIHPDLYTAFLQSLPWKSTFLEPRSVTLPLATLPRTTLAEEKIQAEIAKNETVLSKKPNIYIFIIESFRSDIIDPKTAPHLHALKEKTLQSQLTLSNANATNHSWFSIFHSQFSHHWHQLQKQNWEMGSPPLNLLKKWGYQIRLYSSAQLGYYGMEPLLFGRDNQLLASDQKFLHSTSIPASQTDAAALEKMQSDLKNNPALREGQVCIVFWDSTHFDYSWPKNSPAKFAPFANEFSYFSAFHSRKKIELIMNRYRNSVYYIDSLLGKFLASVPNPEEAIVIITGDHGEEFFERGHLFHGSHLVKEQTRIPLIMKFGNRVPAGERHIVSQIDIFPSILDHLSGAVPSFLQGQSVFQEEKWPFAILTRFNAGRTPYEICLHSPKYKLIAQFSNRRDIFQSTSLQVRSLRSIDDNILPRAQHELHGWIQAEFGPALDALTSH